MTPKRTKFTVVAFIATAALTLMPSTAQAQRGRSTQTQRPNILVIWGDDVGITNISAYSHGMMGKPASFSVGDALKMLQTAPHGK